MKTIIKGILIISATFFAHGYISAFVDHHSTGISIISAAIKIKNYDVITAEGYKYYLFKNTDISERVRAIQQEGKRIQQGVRKIEQISKKIQEM